MKRLAVLAVTLLGLVLLRVASAAADSVVNGEILDYEKGYVVLTNGASYSVSPNVKIVDAQSGAVTSEKPAVGLFAQLVVGPDGKVIELGISRVAITKGLKLPSLSEVNVPLTPYGAGPVKVQYAKVTFTVLVPSTTLTTDQVYMSTSETSWTPTAVRMDRIDARHFRVTIQVPVGTTFLYLYTRGSPQSLERGNNGLQRPARQLGLQSTENYAQSDVIDHWGNEAGTTILPPPQTFPTPYNPAPYPNLPPSPGPLR